MDSIGNAIETMLLLNICRISVDAAVNTWH